MPPSDHECIQVDEIRDLKRLGQEQAEEQGGWRSAIEQLQRRVGDPGGVWHDGLESRPTGLYDHINRKIAEAMNGGRPSPLPDLSEDDPAGELTGQILIQTPSPHKLAKRVHTTERLLNQAKAHRKWLAIFGSITAAAWAARESGLFGLLAKLFEALAKGP